MAASRLSSGMISQSRRLCQSLVNFSKRLYVSSNNENSTSGNDGTVADSVSHNSFSEAAARSEADKSTGLASIGALEKFAKVVEKVKLAQSEVDNNTQESIDDQNESFASMVRNSKLVSLAEIQNRLVEGKIIEVMDDDLYIDFGGKFHCVCPRPKKNMDKYHRGTRVLLNLQCLEMSSAFLGSDIDVTLLEADATLLGLKAVPKHAPGTRQRPSTSS